MYPVLNLTHMLNFLDTFSVGVTMLMNRNGYIYMFDIDANGILILDYFV
jgi:hypothetical protein